jgi:hypothetical protein
LSADPKAISGSGPGGTATKADIQAKLRDIRTEVDQTTTKARQKIERAAVIGLVAVVAVAYFLGRRKGRKRSTVVEIRRV